MRALTLIAVLWLLKDLIYCVEALEKLNITIHPDVVVRQEDLVDCHERSDPTLEEKGQEVKVSVSILDIDEINENHMEFRLHCWVTLNWVNQRINFNVANRNRALLLPRLLSQCMWKPDVIFPNTKEIITFDDTVPNLGYKLLTNGQIYRVQRFMLRIECPMQFSLYPMDTQHCFFRIALLTSPDELVKLFWNMISKKKPGVFFAYNIHPLQFHVMKPKAHYLTASWYTGNYTELWANITFHRRLTGSVVNFYLPSTLVVFLSWLSFYIDVDAAPARVSLGVTALLTITTQMVQARNILPPVQYITLLDVWLFSCLIQVFASFIEYSIAYSFRHSLKKSRKSSKAAKVWPIGKLKSVLSKSEIDLPALSKQESRTPPILPMILSCNPFDKHSRWIFPTFMITFASVYWFYLFSSTEVDIF